MRFNETYNNTGRLICRVLATLRELDLRVGEVIYIRPRDDSDYALYKVVELDQYQLPIVSRLLWDGTRISTEKFCLANIDPIGYDYNRDVAYALGLHVGITEDI
jgi:hypothetical protein